MIANEKDASGRYTGYVDKPFFLREDNIIKHSFNIIDLIEVGDYVNGEYTIGVCAYKNGNIKFIEVGELLRELENKDIESIVTHEQFNSIKYVIGE